MRSMLVRSRQVRGFQRRAVQRTLPQPPPQPQQQHRQAQVVAQERTLAPCHSLANVCRRRCTTLPQLPPMPSMLRPRPRAMLRVMVQHQRRAAPLWELPVSVAQVRAQAQEVGSLHARHHQKCRLRPRTGRTRRRTVRA